MAKKKHKEEKKKEKQESKTSYGKFEMSTKQIRWALVLLLSLLFSVISLFWTPGDLIYRMTEKYTFTQSDPGFVELTVLMPKSGPYQDVAVQEIVWPGEWNVHSSGKINLIQFNADLTAGETVEAVIKYKVTLRQGSVNWVGDIARTDDITPSEDIQSDNHEIITQARELALNDDARETAKQIFDFTMAHLAWPDENRNHQDTTSALEAYRTGVGGVSEHAYLMTALCRAANIPARTINGLMMPESFPLIPVAAEWGHPAIDHSWVEVFVDNTWIMADPSRSGSLIKRDLFAWTDGKHLAYDDMMQESEVYFALIAEAEKNGQWVEGISAPARFVAWAEVPPEAMVFTPRVVLRKVWDARLLMMLSVVIILIVMNWLYSDNKTQTSH